MVSYKTLGTIYFGIQGIRTSLLINLIIKDTLKVLCRIVYSKFNKIFCLSPYHSYTIKDTVRESILEFVLF